MSEPERRTHKAVATKTEFSRNFFYYLLENLCLYLNFYVVIILHFCVNGKWCCVLIVAFLTILFVHSLRAFYPLHSDILCGYDLSHSGTQNPDSSSLFLFLHVAPWVYLPVLGRFTFPPVGTLEKILLSFMGFPFHPLARVSLSMLHVSVIL